MGLHKLSRSQEKDPLYYTVSYLALYALDITKISVYNVGYLILIGQFNTPQ